MSNPETNGLLREIRDLLARQEEILERHLARRDEMFERHLARGDETFERHCDRTLQVHREQLRMSTHLSREQVLGVVYLFIMLGIGVALGVSLGH